MLWDGVRSCSALRGDDGLDERMVEAQSIVIIELVGLIIIVVRLPLS